MLLVFTGYLPLSPVFLGKNTTKNQKSKFLKILTYLLIFLKIRKEQIKSKSNVLSHSDNWEKRNKVGYQQVRELFFGEEGLLITRGAERHVSWSLNIQGISVAWGGD